VLARTFSLLLAAGVSVHAFSQSIAALPGIAIPENTIVVAPQPGGGLQAIDIVRGSILWTTSRASWALASGQGKVVALGNLGSGNTCSICFIDDQTGKVTAEVGPIQFVSWAKVRPTYGHRSDSDFHIWVQTLNSTGAALLWKAERWSPLDIRHLNQPQQKEYASGRITLNFANNSVDTRQMPINASPPTPRPPDSSLPLLRGQRALGSLTMGRDGSAMLALISTGSNVNLECFVNQVLRWSRSVISK
jgi:hypothetical protein